MLEKRKILITGATGFIGANLLRKCLKLGARTAILTRETSNKWRIRDVLKDVNEYCVDLLDYERLEAIVFKVKPEIIFHTAAYGGYPFQRDVNRIFKSNMIATVNLINACSKTGFGILVNTGSSSEYGLKSQPMHEADLLEPNSNYGVSKASATLFCQTKARNEKLPVVTLRLFSPYGYYEEPSRLIPSVFISSLKKEDLRLSSPESVRDFVFIEDVVAAYMKAVENRDRIGGEIFNIGSGRQSSVREVVDNIIRLNGNKISQRWGSLFNPRSEPKIWQADISRAKGVLGWEPTYDLVRGLEKTLIWFENNLHFMRQKSIL